MAALPKAPRRPEGWLRDQLHGLLASAERPLSGAALCARLTALHSYAHSSAVFRALNKMWSDGEVERIELLSGYVLRRPEPVIAMVCSRCGAYQEARGVPTVDLTRLARRAGFAPTRLIVEVKGRCATCRQP